MSSVPLAQIVSQYGWPIPIEAFLRKPFGPDTLRDKILETTAGG